MRSVARHFRVSLRTVQRWVTRAKGLRLRRADLCDKPSGSPCPHNRTPMSLEDSILATRKRLKDSSDLGEFGAAAIRLNLVAAPCVSVPSLRTIGRILKRRGALDGRLRIRRPPPPSGWYLPAVAAGRADIDLFDVVEDLVIRGGIDVNVLNATSLHGGLKASWPQSVITAKFTLNCLLEHWRQQGLPAYAQFDNDTRFQGAHHLQDSVGRVIRLCLSLDVVPVFSTPGEHGFQNPIEHFNGLWQAKVWQRFRFCTLPELQAQSTRYIAAIRTRFAARLQAAPARRPFPQQWHLDLQAPLRGTIIYLRRTDASGRVHCLGHTFDVDPNWPFRLVRTEVLLDQQRIRFIALRRKDPARQPVLRQLAFTIPPKPFME